MSETVEEAIKKPDGVSPSGRKTKKWWQGTERSAFLINAQKSLRTTFSRSKSVDFGLLSQIGKKAFKRQKMAIITAIMVINGNTRTASNSRSNCHKYTTDFTLLQMLSRFL